MMGGFWWGAWPCIYVYIYIYHYIYRVTIYYRYIINQIIGASVNVFQIRPSQLERVVPSSKGWFWKFFTPAHWPQEKKKRFNDQKNDTLNLENSRKYYYLIWFIYIYTCIHTYILHLIRYLGTYWFTYQIHGDHLIENLHSWGQSLPVVFIWVNHNG